MVDVVAERGRMSLSGWSDFRRMHRVFGDAPSGDVPSEAAAPKPDGERTRIPTDHERLLEEARAGEMPSWMADEDLTGLW